MSKMSELSIPPSVEFYDLVTRTHSEGGEALRSVMAGIDPTHGPILDVGSGTGRSVQIIAEAVPEARILAVEPDLVMRTVLVHRVVGDDDLRSRVTIFPDTAQEMPVPDKLSAVVLFGVVGMLDREERARLWERLLPALPPGAPIIVELLPISRPQALPSMPYANARIGDHVYEATLEGEPGEDDLMVLNTTWKVSDDQGEVRTVHGTSQWHTFGLEDLAQETGLEAEQLTLQAGVLRVGNGRGA